MFISWRNRPVKGQGGGSFLAVTPDPMDGDYEPCAWHTVRCDHAGSGRVAWTAFLMKSERVDGKPRQKILHRFPSIRSCCIADARTRAAWWYMVLFNYQCWGESIGGIDDEGMYRDWPACLAKLREVVPEPSRRAKSEFARFAAEFDRVQGERREAERRQRREEYEAQQRRQAEEAAQARADSDRRRREAFETLFGSGPDPAADLATLGLKPGATAAEVKARFRELAKVHHPDKGGDPAEFRRVREAYDRAMSCLSRGAAV